MMNWLGSLWTKSGTPIRPDERDLRSSTMAHDDIPGSFPAELPNPWSDEPSASRAATGQVHELPDRSSVLGPLPSLSRPFDPSAALDELGFTTVQASSSGALSNARSNQGFTRPKRVSRDAKSSSGLRKTSSHGGKDLPVIIAVFGMTGTGKSSFISKASGKEVKVGHDLVSCTAEIEEVTCRIDGVDVMMVDTPGFNDTTRSDTDILHTIASWMMDRYGQGMLLTGIVYLHAISDVRMTNVSLTSLRMLRNLCGTRNLNHVVLTTSMWNKVPTEEGTKRETQLLQEGQFWGDMQSQGAMVRRFDNTRQGAVSVLNELLAAYPVVLQLQTEIGVEGKRLIDTSAGQSILEAITKLSKKHNEELNTVRKDMEEALKLNDAVWRNELEKAQQKLERQLKKQKEDMKVLRAPFNIRAWWQRSWRCQGCHIRLTKDKRGPEKGPCPVCGFVQMCA